MIAFKSAAAVAVALFLYAPLASAAKSGREGSRAHPTPARHPEFQARSHVGTSTPKKAPAIRRAPRQRVDDLELPQLG
jgi:hypothetical protein